MAAYPLRLALAFVLASFALGVSPLGRTAAVVPAGGQQRPSATPMSDAPTAAPERPPTVVDRCVDQGADPTPTAYPYPHPLPTDYPYPNPYPMPTDDPYPDAYPALAADSYPAPTAPMPLPARCDEDVRGAYITVVTQPDPNVTSRQGGLVTYAIVATNRGDGSATNARITMPFDPTEVRVVDARFSSPGGWVSALSSDRLALETGAIAEQGGAVTATVRLQTLPDAPQGAALGERASFRWDDRNGDGEGRSNLPRVVVGASDVSEPFDALSVVLTGPIHRFSAEVFAPREPVSSWYTGPDGRVIEAGTTMADSEGYIQLEVDSSSLESGAYTMVSHGHWTTFSAVAGFTVH